MEKVPAEFLEDAVKDLSEILDELRLLPAASFGERNAALSHTFPQKLFRILHTIKGSAQTFGLDGQAKLAHNIETVLSALKDEKINWNTASKNALAESVESLRTNFTHISQNKEPSAVDGQIQALRGLLPEENVHQILSPPDNFPEEILARLSSQEGETLGSAWERKKEILLLELRLNHIEFAAGFKQVRSALEDRAEIIAVISSQIAEAVLVTRFLVAAENGKNGENGETSGGLIEVMKRFDGKVLYQKRNEARTVVELPPDHNAGDEIAGAILHGKNAAEMLGKKVKFLANDPVKISPKIRAQFSRTVATILLHLVRNAVDHGIEFPLERAVVKKPAVGIVEISLKITDKNLAITVCDDGRGTQNTKEIFAGGYSTAQFVSALSGRGVGLEIVWDAVRKAGGTIKVDSKAGHGTKFEIDLPLAGLAD